jgi:hypothetical protein
MTHIQYSDYESEKIDQDEVFYHKDILHFFLKWPKYFPYQRPFLIIFKIPSSEAENCWENVVDFIEFYRFYTLCNAKWFYFV